MEITPETAIEKAEFNTFYVGLSLGFDIHPNTKLVDVVIKGLAKNLEKHGELYCPCSFVKDESTICPCVELRTEGTCHCNLFQKDGK